MRRLGRAWLLAFVVLKTPMDARAAEPDVTPIATRQTAFSIPFKVDRTAATPPEEVHLHVSPDRGGRWDLYDKVKPDRGSFVFRAPHDGEYWFSIRSVDRQGIVTPSGAFTPGLKVIVDTLAPRLDVTAERLSAGELSAQWQIVDPSLKPDSLKIEYRTDDTGEWEELAASQARITEGRSTLTGDGVWWPQNAPGPITLRIQVSDQAGNPAVTQVVVKPVGGEAAQVGESFGSQNRPGEDSQPRLGEPQLGGPSLGTPANVDTGPPRAVTEMGVNRRETRALPISNPAAADTDVERNPFDRYRDRPNGVGESMTAKAPLTPALSQGERGTTEAPPVQAWPAQGSPSRPLDSPASGDSDWRVGNSPGGQRSPGFVHTASGDTSANRSRSADVDGDGSLGRSSSTRFDFTDLSPAERPKMVNSRTFEIEYEVESVGSAGVAKVELFGTRDGGTSWTSLGTDPDNRSPLVVTVRGEGLYGFHVVVHSASGLSGTAPRSGDRPELWIGVDLTHPQATLTGAEPGNNPDELTIYWDARDARLESRPIALYFSDQPSGKWTPIAAGLENTGSYTWRMDSRVKHQLYLKLEVRDEAGNIGRYESPEPISLNRQLPQGRIRNVRPVPPETSGGQAGRTKMIYNDFVR